MAGRTYSKDTREALARLGQQLQAARRERGWSRLELAGRAGVREDAIRSMEAGDPRVYLRIWLDVASLLGVPPFIPDLDPRIISRDPAVMGGEPVFPRTRVPIQLLHKELKQGASLASFLFSYPTVDKEDLLKALDLLFQRTLAPLGGPGEQDGEPSQPDAQEKFDVMITADRGILHLQDERTPPLPVIVLLPDLQEGETRESLMERQVADLLEQDLENKVYVVGKGPRSRGEAKARRTHKGSRKARD